MDLKDACEKILLCEKKFQVNDYKVGDLYAWPFVRSATWILLTTDQRLHPIVKKESFHDCISFVLKKTLNTLYFRKLKRKLVECNVVIVSPAIYYSEFIDNKKYSRVIDPFFELISHKLKCIKLSTENSNNRFITGLQLNFHPLSNSKNYQTSDLKVLCENIASITNLDSEALFMQTKKIFEESISYRNLFYKIFKICKPDHYFTTCYYGALQMGGVIAAKELGITSYDLQHGKQGKYQAMYSHWSKIPKNGYEAMPDFFWNWSLRSSKHIMNWGEDREKHKALPVGNMWLRKALKVYGKTKRPNFLDTTKKCVLLSMQSPEEGSEIIPDYILNFINKNEDFVWLIKPHPNCVLTKSYANQLIKKNPRRLVDVSWVANQSIYQLLCWSDFHITSYSTVVYESVFFKVPSAVWSLNGRKLYERDIKEKVIADVSDYQKLLKFLTNGKEFFAEKLDYYKNPNPKEIFEYLAKN